MSTIVLITAGKDSQYCRHWNQRIRHLDITRSVPTARRQLFLTLLRSVSQYTREAYEHKERKGHPQIAWKLQETVSIL